MPIPLLAVAGGEFLLNKLFNKGPEFGLPPSPNYFGPEFKNYVTAAKQRAKSRYGGVAGDIRETMANYGFGDSGGVPTALNQASIQQGQDVASAEEGAYSTEFGAMRGFQGGPEYTAGLQKNQLDYAHGLDQRQQQLDFVNQIFKLIGGHAGTPQTAVGTSTPTNPGIDNPLDFNVFKNNERDRMHQILKLLLGIG